MSQAVILLLLRHGQILQNPGARRFVGSSERPLDDTGKAQARAVGRALADLGSVGLPLRRVFTSDLERTVDTAKIAMDNVTDNAMAGQDAKPEHLRLPELREICLGDWQGLSSEEVRTRFPGQLERRGLDMAGYCPPGGESFSDLSARVLPALDGLARRTLEAEDRLALVVAHGGVNRAILCAALGLPLTQVLRLPQDYACLNVLIWKPEGLAVRAVNLAASALAPGWAAAYGLGDTA
jgi:probable phosphoglycerate mutase